MALLVPVNFPALSEGGPALFAPLSLHPTLTGEEKG